MKTSIKYYPFQEAIRNPFEVGNLIIDLDTDDIAQLDTQAHLFKNLNSLRLNSKKSSIHQLPIGFLSLKNLKQLSINGERLFSLPSQLFNLYQLNHIAFRSAELREIPKEIWEMTNIKLLQFFKCDSIKSIPDGIMKLTLLNYLRVYSDSIEILPSDLGYCSNLETIDFNSKSLTELPDSMKYSTKLKWFRWAHCRVYPEIINECITLNKLTFDNNNFHCIPDSILNLENLEILDLSFSGFEYLPEPITKIKDLKILVLYESTVLRLPQSLSNLTKLEELHLNHCVKLTSDLDNLLDIFNSIEKLRIVSFQNVNLSNSQKQFLVNNTDKRIKLYV